MYCHRFIDIWFIVVLSTFGLSSFYRRGIICRFVAAFYLCVDNSEKLDIFDQLNILNYGYHYVEELELQDILVTILLNL